MARSLVDMIGMGAEGLGSYKEGRAFWSEAWTQRVLDWLRARS